jgi:hypothetical protein
MVRDGRRRSARREALLALAKAHGAPTMTDATDRLRYGPTMSKPTRTTIPEYDAAATSLATAVIKALAFARSPVLSQIPQSPATELAKDDAPVDIAHGAYAPIGVKNVLTERFDTVLATDVDEWISMLDEQGDKAAEQLETQFFAFMHKVTEDAGQVIDARGRPLTHDLVLDMFEKLQIDFDEDGQPQMPTIVVPPKVYEKLGEPTPEQMKRRDEIIERKRSEFLARRRVRKLE